MNVRGHGPLFLDSAGPLMCTRALLDFLFTPARSQSAADDGLLATLSKKTLWLALLSHEGYYFRCS